MPAVVVNLLVSAILTAVLPVKNFIYARGLLHAKLTLIIIYRPSTFCLSAITAFLADQLLKFSERWWLVHVGYCEEYSYSFRLFFDAWSESSWNSLFVLKEQKFQSESSWNVRPQGTKVPLQRKFHGNKSSICELFAPGNESAEEWNVWHS